MTILTIEQYETSKSLLRVLGKLIDPKSLQKLNIYIIEEEGPNWTLCDYCSETMAECRCDDGPKYYAEYDDEASYE